MQSKLLSLRSLTRTGKRSFYYQLHEERNVDFPLNLGLNQDPSFQSQVLTVSHPFLPKKEQTQATNSLKNTKFAIQSKLSNPYSGN
jgi:hypothetical protein